MNKVRQANKSSIWGATMGLGHISWFVQWSSDKTNFAVICLMQKNSLKQRISEADDESTGCRYVQVLIIVVTLRWWWPRMNCEASTGKVCTVTLTDILRVCGIISGDHGGVGGLVVCHRGEAKQPICLVFACGNVYMAWKRWRDRQARRSHS